jgi:hypothetical protein
MRCARPRAARGDRGGRAISAALDPEVPPAKAAALSLAIIREVDPPVQASVEVSADLTPEDVRSMSYSELIATARALQIEIPEDVPTPPEGQSLPRALSPRLRSSEDPPSEAVSPPLPR